MLEGFRSLCKLMAIPAPRAPYIASVSEFFATEPRSIVGHLSQLADGDVSAMQIQAWTEQIEILRRVLDRSWRASIAFEFAIPRVGSRVDNILLLGDLVLAMEFKVGATQYEAAAQIQAIDYALDLKNFHFGSREAEVFPLLVATQAPCVAFERSSPVDGVHPIAKVNAQSLTNVLKVLAAREDRHHLEHKAWFSSGYRPTPTIVEASQALYRGHGVADITHSEAGSENLGATTDALHRAIDGARKSEQKVICFVSGVPGAGKTLAGLNLICERRKHDATDEEHAVFLSGNGPLVQVLQEALARDEVQQGKQKGVHIAKTGALRRALAMIQNIHHFRDAYLNNEEPPAERVVVFDEAQRAWNREQASKFMRTKRNKLDFCQSEPEFLISVMDRHPGWAAIVCLIGCGQEINTGEAGLAEWLRAVQEHFPHWHVCLPKQLDLTSELPSWEANELKGAVTRDSALHLSTSLRSFRAEHLSQAVAELMSGNTLAAKVQLQAVIQRFPIVLTRSLATAKRWVKTKARGSERYGVLASSGAKRLKPLGLNMSVKIDSCAWFLNDAEDVRSSFYMEDAGSEFDVQGLELDWSVVIWDGDLVHQSGGWRYKNFSGTRWQDIHKEQDQRYRLNAYRVLLTRARQGMVIVVPQGDSEDPTRDPQFYDPTWAYLRELGMLCLDDITPA